MGNDVSGVQALNAFSTRSNRAHRCANDQTIVKLFDAYIEQGIDNDNARLLIRASLGLSRQVVLETLAQEGRL